MANVEHDLKEMLTEEEYKSYISRSIPKVHISSAIQAERAKRELSVRALAEKVGMKHPQIIRVTGCNNYEIDTLLDILHELDLEIIVVPKGGTDA